MNSTAQTNQKAWNTGRYDAWVQTFGAPSDEAVRLIADPDHKLRRLLPHLGEVRGQRVCNIQGSHGRIAVALALKGAAVTVIDFADENRRYALELAQASGVSLDYRTTDVMSAASLGLEPFDSLVMELGILHYHLDLAAFFRVMAQLTGPDGKLVLNEFHPFERKLRHAAAKDYFASEPVIGAVPKPTGSGLDLGTCAYRYWTLGEIVTAAIEGGWRIERLEEQPLGHDPKFPGTFTLVASVAPSERGANSVTGSGELASA